MLHFIELYADNPNSILDIWMIQMIFQIQQIIPGIISYWEVYIIYMMIFYELN